MMQPGPAKLVAALLLTGASAGLPAQTADWDHLVAEARGAQVWYNGWGGSAAINDYMSWAAEEVAAAYDITLERVRTGDISEVVGQVLAEKTAGREQGGSVDLLWINGENFRAMQQQDLLLAPWTHRLPNYALLDIEHKPTLMRDFSTPVNHQEAPWGMAQLTFMVDSARVDNPPQSMEDLLAFARANPGRVTYPALPGFYGTTFVKQVLLEQAADTAPFYQPMAQADNVEALLEPLWTWLDALHEVAWRGGNRFAADAGEMRQLLNDGEILISLSFNPNDASNAIYNGELPASVRSYTHTGGTLGNTHFLAIPFNASEPEAAMVVTNFLMSPEAQARKADISVWGDPTVLAVSRLAAADRARFEQLDRGPAGLSEADLARVLPEPHVSWVEAIEAEWQRRYAR